MRTEQMEQKTATQTRFEVYDPAMCCSTGVCGTDVDDALVNFANDVKWMKAQGIDVQRFNLGQEPEAFKQHPYVLTRLQTAGSDCLPIVFANGEIISEGSYPDRARLESLIKSANGQPKPEEKPAFTYDERVDALVTIAAAVAAGSADILQQAFEKGRELGLGNQELSKAMQQGLDAKQRLTEETVITANKLLGVQPSNGCAPGSGCC